MMMKGFLSRYFLSEIPSFPLGKLFGTFSLFPEEKRRQLHVVGGFVCSVMCSGSEKDFENDDDVTLPFFLRREKCDGKVTVVPFLLFEFKF